MATCREVSSPAGEVASRETPRERGESDRSMDGPALAASSHDAEGKSSTDGKGGTSSNLWASLDDAALRRLVAEQVPRFQNRPYLADSFAVHSALAAGLEGSLEGDYCWSLSFAPEFVRTLCAEGFVPISCELGGNTGLFVLLPKLHEERCVLHFDSLHVPRKVRRRALRESHRLSVDDAFDAVLAGCVRQHGDTWLHPPLRSALEAMSGGSSADPVAGDAGAVRVCSFALWHGHELVAGEFGVAIGRVYTSFSGFHTANGAGALQIVLTAMLLRRAGFAWWDLGQAHDYKIAHGATVMPRTHFLDQFRRQRALPNAMAPLLASREDGASFGAAELLRHEKERASARADGRLLVPDSRCSDAVGTAADGIALGTLHGAASRCGTAEPSATLLS